jgi:hypothetical protein
MGSDWCVGTALRCDSKICNLPYLCLRRVKYYDQPVSTVRHTVCWFKISVCIMLLVNKVQSLGDVIDNRPYVQEMKVGRTIILNESRIIQQMRTLLHECCSLVDIITQCQATELHIDEILQIRLKPTVLQDTYDVSIPRHAYFEDYSDFLFDIRYRNMVIRTNYFSRKAL